MNLAQVLDAELIRNGGHRLPVVRPMVEPAADHPPELRPDPAHTRYPGVRPAILEALETGPMGSKAILEHIREAGVESTDNAMFHALRSLLDERRIVATKRGFTKTYSLRRPK